jgi:DNA invertase Pin-like site-specific DNA recombinase
MNPAQAAPVDLTVPLAVIAIAGLLSTALLSVPWRNNRRRARPAPQAPTASRRLAIGYTTASASAGASKVHATLDGFCRERGWSLARIIEDAEPDSGRMSDRPGLFQALEMLTTGRASCLVVARLRDLTSSVSDLGPLMRWIEDARACVVVLDVHLDTTSGAGSAAVLALAEVGSWKRETTEQRTRTTRAPGRSPGRPSVHDDPELVAWIARMRADGMSLQAIADALNENGVPTLRGGARWRPSSVQSAVGYKRPPAETRMPQLPRVPQ